MIRLTSSRFLIVMSRCPVTKVQTFKSTSQLMTASKKVPRKSSFVGVSKIDASSNRDSSSVRPSVLTLTRFKCPHCSHTEDSKAKVKQHISTLHKKEPYTCPHCSKGFTNFSVLNKHIRTEHRGLATLKEPYEKVIVQSNETATPEVLNPKESRDLSESQSPNVKLRRNTEKPSSSRKDGMNFPPNAPARPSQGTDFTSQVNSSVSQKKNKGCSLDDVTAGKYDVIQNGVSSKHSVIRKIDEKYEVNSFRPTSGEVNVDHRKENKALCDKTFHRHDLTNHRSEISDVIFSNSQKDKVTLCSISQEQHRDVTNVTSEKSELALKANVDRDAALLRTPEEKLFVANVRTVEKENELFVRPDENHDLSHVKEEIIDLAVTIESAEQRELYPTSTEPTELFHPKSVPTSVFEVKSKAVCQKVEFSLTLYPLKSFNIQQFSDPSIASTSKSSNTAETEVIENEIRIELLRTGNNTYSKEIFPLSCFNLTQFKDHENEALTHRNAILQTTQSRISNSLYPMKKFTPSMFPRPLRSTTDVKDLKHEKQTFFSRIRESAVDYLIAFGMPFRKQK